ncbi:hypothetical protein GGTG_01471 [Gaeumannomyces tritici R3-111a-1]|uniref:Uncharacterized protein n=1 Tax=Gaeumannomyces tritici (strain R3-111a-1) TaxID=644352 RepID=J3NJP1_GAET3|nr:hypothetical protein GGTG_01471 [Gaeumannomyces tritici R3-111a-1]EJT81493.1 hypothetical protein GGTG_01471 [Gaeumannomyces tritici R3-111a-1]
MASSAADQPAAAAAKPAATYSTDPALYIYTSLTAGSSHIVTATSRLETILRANRIPFKAIDMATDEKARMLWGRRAGKDESGRARKLPGLVQEGLILGDLVEIEEWNEYGELKQHVKIFYDDFTQPSISQAPKMPPVQPKRAVPPAAASAAAAGAPGATTALPVLSVAEEAAAKAKQIRLQSLRDKVYGKGNSGPPAADDSKSKEGEGAGKAGGTEKEAAAAEPKKPAAISLASAAPKPAVKAADGAGLQSPTTGAWKGGSPAAAGGGPASSQDLLRTLQSPTSTAWKPTDVDPPVTSHRGSLVSPASPEEIEAVEKELAIKEEPEEEEEEEEDDDDDDDDDEEDSGEDSDDDDDEDEKEEEPKKAVAAAAPAKSAEPAKDTKTPESKDTKA